ncbi:hypothetical protein Vadar_008644 [Vaccinium darrowii]|uniref:Uncharacterized protein n=1 Tax=Vaccinium darrowii TaxID=229202 RepID=A0ACB7Z3W8_9ERIC|nr:hypothetical protein Vadar_008644 [Vaccinium darrowii]
MDSYSNFSFDLILKPPQHSNLLTHSASLEQKPSGKWFEILVDEFMMSPKCVGIMEFALRNHDVNYGKEGLAVKCVIIRPKK